MPWRSSILGNLAQATSKRYARLRREQVLLILDQKVWIAAMGVFCTFELADVFRDFYVLEVVAFVWNVDVRTGGLLFMIGNLVVGGAKGLTTEIESGKILRRFAQFHEQA